MKKFLFIQIVLALNFLNTSLFTQQQKKHSFLSKKISKKYLKKRNLNWGIDVSVAYGKKLLTNEVSPITSGSVEDTSTSGKTTFNGSICTTKNMKLPTTSASTAGVVTVNSLPFIHSYGTNNTFLGSNAGNFTLTGSNNSSLGYNSLHAATSGNQNTAVGSNALQSTSGSNNTCIGYNAGSNYTGSEDNNIVIGNAGTASESNKIRIGTNGTQTSCNIAGITGVTVTGSAVFVTSSDQLGILLSSRRYKEDIQNMDATSAKLIKLRPVSFKYKDQPEDAPLEYGLIAEEVAEVFPELVLYDKNGEPETVKYHTLPTLLLNEYQQQQNQLDKHEKELLELINRLTRLERNVQRK